MNDFLITGVEPIGDQHTGTVGAGYSTDPELLRQCEASGQMSAAQAVCHGLEHAATVQVAAAVITGNRALGFVGNTAVVGRHQPGPLDREPGFIKPDTDRQVFFYEQDFYVLSNFSAFRLVWQGLDFDTSEHAYHWEKFATEEDDQTCNSVAYEIARASSAHQAFKIAEAHKHLRRPDWDAVKVDVMLGILRAKAAQHEYVRRKLLATGDRELIEDSWRDDFWGWGPNRDGQNMLGKLWMQVRAELRGSDGGVREGTNRTTNGWIGQP